MRLSRDALRFGLFRTSTVVHWCGWLDFLSSLLICSVVRSFVRLYGQSIGDWSINPSTIQWSLMIKTTRVHTHTYKQNGTHTSFDLYYWLFPNSFWNATLSSVHFDGPVEVSPVEICLLALWVLHSKFSCGTLTRWLFSSAIHLMWWAHAAPPGPILWGNVPSRNSFTRVQLERICFCVPAALLWLVALSWSTRKSVCVCVCVCARIFGKLNATAHQPHSPRPRDMRVHSFSLLRQIDLPPAVYSRAILPHSPPSSEGMTVARCSLPSAQPLGPFALSVSFAKSFTMVCGGWTKIRLICIHLLTYPTP